MSEHLLVMQLLRSATFGGGLGGLEGGSRREAVGGGLADLDGELGGFRVQLGGFRVYGLGFRV